MARRPLDKALDRFAAGPVEAHILHPQTRDALLRRGLIRPVPGVTRILLYAGVFFKVPGAYELVPHAGAAPVAASAAPGGADG